MTHLLRLSPTERLQLHQLRVVEWINRYATAGDPASLSLRLSPTERLQLHQLNLVEWIDQHTETDDSTYA